MTKRRRGRPRLPPGQRRELIAARLPRELVRELRKRAREQKTTMTDLVEEGLRIYLQLASRGELPKFGE